MYALAKRWRSVHVFSSRASGGRSGRGGFTLIEVLAATALTLLIMSATVFLFADVSGTISGAQAMISANDRLRAAQERLARDLRGITVPLLSPIRPEHNLGYFEYVEGAAADQVQPLDENGALDQTVGDTNDLVMFTSRSSGEPFVGRFGAGTAQSQVAEIAWFVRGTTLYRRVLLVMPDTTVSSQAGFSRDYDVSVPQVGGNIDPDSGADSSNARLVANSLGDLTKRENRFAHVPRSVRINSTNFGYPHSVARWGQLGLPLLRECSDPSWPLPLVSNGTGAQIPITGLPAVASSTDYWFNPHPWTAVNAVGGFLTDYNGSRYAEDIILTNVIGFDVKVWDPEAPVFLSGGSLLEPGDPGYAAASGGGMPADSEGAFVDLNYAGDNSVSHFSGPGNAASSNLVNTYCTWSTHYEHDGVDQDGDGTVDQAVNGFDDNGQGGIDDASEWECPPPYPFPVRGIQIKLRIFEPDSRQVREVTVMQSFLPE